MVITSNKLGLRPMTNIKMNCPKNVCKILPGSCWKKVHLVVQCKSMKKNQAINFHLIYDPFQSHQTSKISLPTLTPYWLQWKATATRLLTVRWWFLTVKREFFFFPLLLVLVGVESPRKICRLQRTEEMCLIRHWWSKHTDIKALSMPCVVWVFSVYSDSLLNSAATHFSVSTCPQSAAQQYKCWLGATWLVSVWTGLESREVFRCPLCICPWD